MDKNLSSRRGGEPRLLGDILSDYLASNEPLARGYRAYLKEKGGEQ